MYVSGRLFIAASISINSVRNDSKFIEVRPKDFLKQRFVDWIIRSHAETTMPGGLLDYEIPDNALVRQETLNLLRSRLESLSVI